MAATSPEDTLQASLLTRIGICLGPLIFFLIWAAPTPAVLSVESQRVAAITALMAIWWISEAVPIPVTSLLPIVLFPALRVMPVQTAAAPYANHLIYLFLGGFMIAIAMQQWNLHRRIALLIIKYVGFSPGRLVLGFMIATAALSAFVSNTATAVMMMPIGLAIISQATEEIATLQLDAPPPAVDAFAKNLMLGIAYAASIGGMATIIGTPPNTVLASYLQGTYGYELSFGKWLMVGLPLAVVFVPLAWLWLTRIANPMKGLDLPSSDEIILAEFDKLGPMSRGERATLIVFATTAVCWIARGIVDDFFPQIDMIKDSSIAIAGAVVLFLIPTDWKRGEFVLNWESASKLPWGVLILFGGGLSLAEGFKTSGLTAWTVDQAASIQGISIIALIVVIALVVNFLTELTSNTATTTLLMPVLAGVAIGMGENPLLLLAPAALSASCAFMLPVATPPNAIVFGSGKVAIPDMMKSGFALNLMGVFLVSVVTYLVLIPVFGIVLGQMPEWMP